MPYAAPYSEWSEERKEKHRQSVKNFRAKNPEKVRQGYDDRNTRRRELYRTDESYRETAKALSRAAMPVVQRERARRLKDRVFSHYGYICACCGETEKGFLTIDHVNNDGAKHRDELTNGKGRNGGGTVVLHLDIIRQGFPDTFRILCYNCNCGRARYGGICPHERERQASAAMLQSTQASVSDCIS